MNDEFAAIVGSTLAGQLAALWDRGGDPPDLRGFLQSHKHLAPRDLADVILVDQAFRWSRGHPTPAEAYFEAWPEVTSDDELRLDIVYGEYRARLQQDESPDKESFFRRFPDLSDALGHQFEVSRWLLETETPLPGDPPTTTAARDAAPTRPPMDRPAIDPEAPLLLNDFQLQEKLGSGAMGEVYRAIQKSLRKPVAVKILKKGVTGDREIVARFLREARAVASLKHPHIVNVHGIGRSGDGGYFLVMDLVEGTSLDKSIQRGPLPVDEAVRLVSQIAEAIDHANARGVIHRDLKPSNILLDGEGKALVTDFGLAKHVQAEDPGISMPGEIIGTPQYMAPEQASSRLGSIGPATDVYGLGALFYVLLTSKPPLKGGTALEVISRLIAGEQPDPPRSVCPQVPPAVEAVCLKCLSANPRDRYGSGREVADALLACGPAESSHRKPPSPSSGKASLSPRQVLAWLGGGALAALFLLALWLGWWPWGSTNPARDRPLSEDTSHRGAPPVVAPKTIDVQWVVDVYREGREDRKVRLTEHPGPLFNADAIRIHVVFSRPAYAYIYWIGGGGTVDLLYPDPATPDRPVTEAVVPVQGGHGLPIRGKEGTEICVLVLRETALANGDEIPARLRPSHPLPPLDANTIVLDGLPLTGSLASAIADDESGVTVRQILQRLPPEIDSRDLGPAKPLVGAAIAEPLAAWYRNLPADLGEVRYLAIPHLAIPAPGPIERKTGGVPLSPSSDFYPLQFPVKSPG